MGCQLKVFIFCTCAIFISQIIANPVKSTSARIIDKTTLSQEKGACATGVNIEYWYNETDTPGIKYFQSSPGCPKNHNGYQWVYFEQRPKCYLTGYRGPCGEGYILIPKWGTFYGRCVCKCELTPEAKASKQRYVSFRDNEYTRAQIYDKQEKRCYFVGQQGSCQFGEVVKASNGTHINCIAQCDEADLRLNSAFMEAQGLCGLKWKENVCPIGSDENESYVCPVGTSFSKALQKCTKKNNKRLNVIR